MKNKEEKRTSTGEGTDEMHDLNDNGESDEYIDDLEIWILISLF